MAKKTTLKEVGETLAFIVEKMATKDDLKNLATDLEKLGTRLDDRIHGVIVKVDGIQNTLDAEANVRRDQKLPTRVADLEHKVFGKVRP